MFRNLGVGDIYTKNTRHDSDMLSHTLVMTCVFSFRQKYREDKKTWYLREEINETTGQDRFEGIQ